jgi:hypothetical protein
MPCGGNSQPSERSLAGTKSRGTRRQVRAALALAGGLPGDIISWVRNENEIPRYDFGCQFGCRVCFLRESPRAGHYTSGSSPHRNPTACIPHPCGGFVIYGKCAGRGCPLGRCLHCRAVNARLGRCPTWGWHRWSLLASVISGRNHLPATLWRGHTLRQRAVLQAGWVGRQLPQVPSGNRRPQRSGVCASRRIDKGEPCKFPRPQ